MTSTTVQLKPWMIVLAICAIFLLLLIRGGDVEILGIFKVVIAK